MTIEEKEQLKEEIKQEVIRELACNPTKKGHRNSKLDEIREEYINDLHKKYGNCFYWDVWTSIRALSCYFGGVRYVRDINPDNEDRVIGMAEKLLKMALEEERCERYLKR